jgi:hypothetical protein
MAGGEGVTRFVLRLGMITCILTPLIVIPLVIGQVFLARSSNDHKLRSPQSQRDPNDDAKGMREFVARMQADQNKRYFEQMKSRFIGPEKAPADDMQPCNIDAPELLDAKEWERRCLRRPRY